MNQITIYGTGCDKFFETVKNVKNILSTERIKASFSVVTDSSEIVKKGFTNLPAIMINNRLISQGDILSTERIERELAINGQN